MRVLAIDTALGACAAALFDSASAKLIANESLAMTRGHAEALMPLIARIMAKAKTKFGEVDRIAVTIGPGSFTGLRVGISAARGIALASGKPAVGVSTLAAFAAPHVASKEKAAIVAAIEASHGNVYLHAFAAGGQTMLAPCLATIEQAVQAAGRAPVCLVGSAAESIAAAWPLDLSPPRLVQNRSAPDIASVARLGAVAQDTGVPPKPLYLRAPGARPQDAARVSLRP
jgi:tRNA threonylcarbamoyl adenosine modification protein YeaZ